MNTKYFTEDPNNLARGPGLYYSRKKGFYSKVIDKQSFEKVNIPVPMDQKHRETMLNYLQSGKVINGVSEKILLGKLRKN